MAEGVLKHYGQDRIEAFSAGIKPSAVNPVAVKVMAEIGMDISTQCSKSVDEFQGQEFDYVITVCDNAKGSCPVFPGATKVMHWPFPDPSHGQGELEATLNEFRKVRDMIHQAFKDFVPTITKS